MNCRIIIYLVVFCFSQHIIGQNEKNDSTSLFCEVGVNINHLRKASFQPPLIVFYEPKNKHSFINPYDNMSVHFSPSISLSYNREFKRFIYHSKITFTQIKFNYNRKSNTTLYTYNEDFYNFGSVLAINSGFSKKFRSTNLSLGVSLSFALCYNELRSYGIESEYMQTIVKTIKRREEFFSVYVPLGLNADYKFKIGKRICKIDFVLNVTRVLFFKYHIKNNFYNLSLGIPLKK